MNDFEILFHIPFTIYWVGRKLNRPRFFLIATKNFDSTSGEYFYREVQ